MKTPRPTSSRKRTTAKQKVPRKPAASKVKAKTKTRKARPRGQADDADIQIIKLRIPQIDGWPSMDKAFAMRAREIKPLTKLKPSNPYLMKDTGFKIPPQFRAAYNLAMNMEHVSRSQIHAFQQMLQRREGYESVSTGMPGAFTEREMRKWDSDIETAQAVTLFLAGLSDAYQQIIAEMIINLLPDANPGATFVVVRGYRIMQLDLSPKVPWQSRIPETYRPRVAYALFLQDIDPLNVSPELQAHILNCFILRESGSRTRNSKTKSGTKKRPAPSQVRQQKRAAGSVAKTPTQKTSGGTVRTSAPANPTADNTAGPVMGFQLGPNAVRGRKSEPRP